MQMNSKKYILSLVVLAIALGGIAFSFLQKQQPSIPQTFEELIQLSDVEIDNFDVARMNLLCAKGLPGSEDLDIEQCLQKLDLWAQHVKEQEQRCLPAFFQYREKYKNSIALFKSAYLGFAIQGDFKCDYNMALVESGAMEDTKSTRFFHDSSNIFINGLLQNGKGSCSSMPVLMVVLGRRCNYPIYLVSCGGHSFSRWDDGVEKINLEITNSKGVKTESDEYYLKWPRPITAQEIQDECLMRNLSKKEMLGIFALHRSMCLIEHKKYRDALLCNQVAHKIFPQSKVVSHDLNILEKKVKSMENKL